MRLSMSCAIASGLALLSTASLAAMAVPVYENFANGIDATKWHDAGTARYVESGKLRLARAVQGGTAADTGTVVDVHSANLLNTAVPKGIGADIVVKWQEVESCSANPAASTSRARVAAAFFNRRAGGPVAGDRTGDVVAQVMVGQNSASLDPAGMLPVVGVVVECTSADCLSSTQLGLVTFNSVAIGDRVVARMDWDKPNRTFTFTANGVAQTVTYTGAHANGPVQQIAQVGVRTEVPNCASAARPKSGTDALFDNVRVKY